MDDDTSYISLFAQEQRRRGLSVGTIRVRTGHLNAIKAALGSFEAVTRPKLNRWFTERGYIDSTKRGYVDTLSEFFEYGMQCHWFEEDPTVGITLPPVKPDRDAVSDQHVALLLKNAAKLLLRCWLALIAFQGLRPQEVAELTSEDVV
jgi:site-specific recombinase XerD